jgi:signal transduction histidine kinase
MPSRSRSEKRSSISDLGEQEAFLESLGASISIIASLHDESEIVERLQADAQELFDAASVQFVPAGETSPTGAVADGGTLGLPISARGEAVGTLELVREEPFSRLDLIRAKLLAGFAGRALENARLLVEARERENERARLTEQVITAEQDERRRLSIFLHDGPLSSMSGIALMHDAALAAIADGRYDDAAKVVARSLDRERETIRTLRDLTFAIEPLVLRDHGFCAAVRSLGEQIEKSSRITVSSSAEAGDRLGEKAQVALYQIVREALTQAVRRRPQRIDIAVAELGDGGFALEITDNGVEEKRRASLDAIEDRVRILNGRLTVESSEQGGTLVRVAVPTYVAAATG